MQGCCQPLPSLPMIAVHGTGTTFQSFVQTLDYISPRHTPFSTQNYFHQLMKACPHSWKLKRWHKKPRDLWTERKVIQRAECKRKLLIAQQEEWLFKMTNALLEVAAVKISLLCFDPPLCFKFYRYSFQLFQGYILTGMRILVVQFRHSTIFHIF